MKTKKLPESAFLDHTKVKAPYLRFAGIVKTRHGDKVYKYDVRFTQPNKAFLPMGAMHALEHLMAVEMRRYIEGILDISPMGCQTGFYILALQPYDKIYVALAKALKSLQKAKTIPFANKLQCGNYKNHDLVAAKRYAKKMLAGKRNWKKGGEAYMNRTAEMELY